MNRTSKGLKFIIVEADRDSLVPVTRLLGSYGSVHGMATTHQAVEFLSKEVGVAAVCMPGSSHNRSILQAVGAKGVRLPLLLLSSAPTPEFLQTAFCTCTVVARLPMVDADLRTFVESGVALMHKDERAPRGTPSYGAERSVRWAREFHLTERELQVLQAAVSGVTRREMPSVLRVAPSTVRSHVRAILGKCRITYEARNLSELVNDLLRYD